MKRFTVGGEEDGGKGHEQEARKGDAEDGGKGHEHEARKGDAEDGRKGDKQEARGLPGDPEDGGKGDEEDGGKGGDVEDEVGGPDMSHMRDHPMLCASWEGMPPVRGKRKGTKSKGKPKGAVKVSVFIHMAHGMRRYLDNCWVDEGDTTMEGVEMKYVHFWTDWGADVTLEAGRLGEDRKHFILREIERGAVPRFIGLDHLGRKPVRKERFTGEHHLWALKEVQERAQALAEAGLPWEYGPGGEDVWNPKQTLEEARAHMAVNRERKRRRLPDMTVDQMLQAMQRGEDLLPEASVSRGQKGQGGAAGPSVRHIVEEEDPEFHSPTGAQEHLRYVTCRQFL